MSDETLSVDELITQIIGPQPEYTALTQPIDIVRYKSVRHVQPISSSRTTLTEIYGPYSGGVQPRTRELKDGACLSLLSLSEGARAGRNVESVSGCFLDLDEGSGTPFDEPVIDKDGRPKLDKMTGESVTKTIDWCPAEKLRDVAQSMIAKTIGGVISTSHSHCSRSVPTGVFGRYRLALAWSRKLRRDGMTDDQFSADLHAIILFIRRDLNAEGCASIASAKNLERAWYSPVVHPDRVGTYQQWMITGGMYDPYECLARAKAMGLYAAAVEPASDTNSAPKRKHNPLLPQRRKPAQAYVAQQPATDAEVAALRKELETLALPTSALKADARERLRNLLDSMPIKKHKNSRHGGFFMLGRHLGENKVETRPEVVVALARACIEASGSDLADSAKELARGLARGAALPRNEMLSTGDCAELAARVQWQLERAGGEIVSDGLGLYQYDSGRWKVIPESLLCEIIDSYSGKPVERDDFKGLRISFDTAPATIKYILRKLKVDNYWQAAKRGLVFSNGFVSVGDNGAITLEPHSPEHRCRRGVPWDWDPAAECPHWDKFRESIWQECLPEDRAERIALSDAYFGSVMLGCAPRWQRVVLLTGGGGNGKSMLMNVVEALIMTMGGVVSRIAPQDMRRGPRVAMLDGSLLNSVAELPELEIMDDSGFKAIVDGWPVTAEKKYRDPVDIIPIAGHVFSTNVLAPVKSRTEAFFRRWIVLSFDHRFLGAEAAAREGKVADKVPDIDKAIIATDLPGILVSMIQEAAEALGRGDTGELPSCAASQAAVLAWQEEASIVAQWVREEREILPAETSYDDWEASSVGYKDFAAYARESGHPMPPSATKFKNELRALGVGVHRVSAGVRLQLRKRVHNGQRALEEMGLLPNQPKAQA